MTDREQKAEELIKALLARLLSTGVRLQQTEDMLDRALAREASMRNDLIAARREIQLARDLTRR